MSETTRRDRRPYPAYRDSGTDWLGEVPSHWDVKPLKHAVLINSETLRENTPSDASIRYLDIGNVDGLGRIIEAQDMVFEDAPSRARRVLRDGDVIVSTVRTYLRAIAFIEEAGEGLVGSTGFAVLRPVDGTESRFMRWFATCDPFVDAVVSHSTGVGYPAIAPSVLGTLSVCLPPLGEQRAIAAYLDREAGLIDALITCKERHIALLREHRQSVVSTTITRGLNPEAPMTGSGHAWTGSIPMHWSVQPLMHLTPDDRQIMYGIVLPGPHVEGGVPIVKAGSVGPGRLRLSKLRRTDPEIESGYVRSRLKGGDIVYAIRGSIGAAELVPAELEGANLTQDAARIAPRDGVHGPWLLHAVRSSALFAQLEAGSLGAAVKGINIRDLKRGLIPVPPLGEQQAIAAHLDAETDRIDSLVATVLTSIERLREYRAALIAAAVTGRIDIRTPA